MLHENLTDVILGAFFQIHHELGIGYPEAIYAAAMECVLAEAGLRVRREAPIEVFFRGRVIGRFRLDLIVEDAVLVELKSMRRPDPAFEAQTLGYLRSTRLEVGLLLYFNPKPATKRLIFTNDRKIFA